MKTLIGVGVSTNLDSFTAGKEAARTAFYQLSRHNPEILIVFISPIFNQLDVIKGVRSVIEEAQMIGCSTAGSITTYGSVRYSVTVCAISSESIDFTCGIGHNISKNSRTAGSKAAKESVQPNNASRQFYLIFCDGLSGNSTDILRGAQEELGTSFPILGGPASDDLNFQQTFQYFNNHIYTDSAVGLLVKGRLEIGIGKAHGWQSIGKPHKITNSGANTVKSIDKKIAVEFYAEYLGKDFDELKREGIAKLGSSYPLGAPIKQKGDYLIRAPLRINDNGSLTLSAEMPESENISLMIGDKNSLLDATKQACKEALENIKRSKIDFAIIFSDIGRLQLLRKDSQDEIAIIKEALGNDVPFFGCYTCGVYAPIDTQDDNRQSCFQNQAISVAVFAEQ